MALLHRIFVLAIVPNLMFIPHAPARQPVANVASKRMADGKRWMTRNLDVSIAQSYCYEDKESNCLRYGRLYTWQAAQRACESLGAGWRLPANEDWQQMAKHYGGVRDDSDDGGKAAFSALVTGGRSGFEVKFGGGRSEDGQYARLEAHGFFWTASESGPRSAWLYNFGQAHILNRHSDIGKQGAFSVRCIHND